MDKIDVSRIKYEVDDEHIIKQLYIQSINISNSSIKFRDLIL